MRVRAKGEDELTQSVSVSAVVPANALSFAFAKRVVAPAVDAELLPSPVTTPTSSKQPMICREGYDHGL